MYTFIETPLFTRLVSEHLTDEEYAALQDALAAVPESGALIRGSGGLRKLRWSARGRGKRGGVRVIYCLRSRAGVIWMLTIYAKNVADSIPTRVLRKIAQEIEDDEAKA